MRTNVFNSTSVFTHEGAKSSNISPLQRLKRISLACMLWEDSFYVDGKKSAEILEETCEKVDKSKIVEVALDAHNKGLLRHLPLYLIIQALKKSAKCKDAIYEICSRPDQMTELLSMWWKNGKKPLPAQLKKGLAKAFTRFDEYQLSKYNRNAPVKLRDVLFMCRPKPLNDAQDALWKRLIDNKLAIAETWETKLSAGNDKKESFQELLKKGKLGKLAIVRNIRNMAESGVSKELVEKELMKKSRPILPFQFIAAAKAYPKWEDIIDVAMIQSCENKEKLTGKTIILVDVSGSMDEKLSSKSEMTRLEAACGIAILLREICENVEIATFSVQFTKVPNRRGMALKDAIINSQMHAGTYLSVALRHVINIRTDRLIVITDEQTHDTPPIMPYVHKGYIINVGTYQNGIYNNNKWLTITGFSEAVIDYIIEVEKDSA